MNVLRVFSVAAGVAVLCMGLFGPGTVQANDWSANVSAQNNYIWRGLTQTQNDVAVSGGIDFTVGNGAYAGTWISNVSYAPGDDFSYEHDIYAGYGGEIGAFSYDVGYLYYNYDDEADFDFGELYGSISTQGLTLGLNLLANTEANEAPGQDFGFGQAVYLYADYGLTLGNEVDLSFHVGWHEGDFNEAFNGVPGDYLDFSVSIAKNGFSLMVSTTDLDDAGSDGLDNDEVKFVVAYTHEFSLNK